jgi:hypothetical protein
MWAPLARILGLKPAPPVSVRGEALAAPISAIRPAPGAAENAAALIFTSADGYRDDPVFLSRVQWRLQELLYDGAEPSTAAEAATRDKFLKMGLAADRLRTYHLSNAFAPTVPLYMADVALTPALHAAGLNFNDHDCLFRVRYDLAGSRAATELSADLPTPTAIARRRLEGMLDRDARFVWAELVQANYRLYQPGTDSAACMVMFSFDYAVSADEMRAWGEQLHPLKFTNPSDPVLRKAVWPLEVDDRAWYYHRRFRMPDEFTSGRTVYLADLWAHRPFIDGHFRSRQELGSRPRRVPLLAEKKETGWAGIELVPFNEADDYQRRATQRNA